MSLIQSYRLRRPPLQRNPPNDTQSTNTTTNAAKRKIGENETQTCLLLRTVVSKISLSQF